MHFDPRDYDSRDDLRLAETDSRDRDDGGRDLGRGPGDSRDRRRSREDERWPERDRGYDPREAFTRDLNLPRGLEREIVRDRDREYTMRGSETRTLATVGAFRVVSSRDLRDQQDRPLDPRSSDLRHLREQGLVETVRVPGSRDYAVALTPDCWPLFLQKLRRDGRAVGPSGPASADENPRRSPLPRGRVFRTEKLEPAARRQDLRG